MASFLGQFGQISRGHSHRPIVAFASGFWRSIDLETETMKVTTPVVTAETAKDRETTRTMQESDINNRKFFHHRRKRLTMVVDNLKKDKVAQSELKWYRPYLVKQGTSNTNRASRPQIRHPRSGQSRTRCTTKSKYSGVRSPRLCQSFGD